MMIIPMQPIASQSFQVTLANQNVQINIYQKFFGLFCDLYNVSNNKLIIGGVLCENLNRIVRSLYLGFVGDLEFVDTQGKTDPYYTGLGSRYLLAYLETTDLAAGEG